MASRLRPVAFVGGRLATGLQDVTTDLSALDSAGFWLVVLNFEGEGTCARFADVREAGSEVAASVRWAGPSLRTWESSLDRSGFYAAVSTIRAAIAAGDVYQVNLCRVLSAPVPRDSDVVALAAALQAGNPAPHAAVVRLPDQRLHVASASPELFLRRNGQRVLSRPIKGTAAPGDRLTGKDVAENVMIVDLVRNDLGRVCAVGTVNVPELCQVEHHPGLDHLVSTVSGRLLPGVGWVELLQAAFPPGSVSGAPKLAALDLIRRLEPIPRGPYCGATGWVDADARQGELNVAIRTFWLDQRRLCFGTGAGITWDSTPEGEWQETELKARKLLALASPEVIFSAPDRSGTTAPPARLAAESGDDLAGPIAPSTLDVPHT
ncbi:MAG: anthranilate synthase component I family protein [Actinomycetota bacterium]|nr:anthranilate synthase component I family protein [Actinomycetota bacterium]